MATVPNHSQVDRIASDLRQFSQGTRPTDWHGNSYSGYTFLSARHDGIVYVLQHWNTSIAEFVVKDGAVKLIHFDARYHSSTTRSFQGRILTAMEHAAVDPTPGQTSISWELSRPTGARTVLTLES